MVIFILNDCMICIFCDITTLGCPSRAAVCNNCADGSCICGKLQKGWILWNKSL